MTIYDIDERITSLIDPETGEILDIEAFNELNMARDEKVENVALWIKELSATSSAMKNEIDALKDRKAVADRRIESLKRYLLFALEGQKFSTPRASITFRKSKRCVPADGFVEWAQKNGRDDLLNYKEPTISLSAIKSALEVGDNVPAELVESVSCIVK